ncbi:hypothetical protein BDL97_18G059800 [Sphagnum fallax]|uniref:Uncharacterized protein n=2 Tax=Sphagnum jensenii TaxID=128206 RepID=A0ABP0WHE3_9BRYO|nr:hypothetical protein BDL97_18G059800 [Sphagnum fallax]
MGLITSRTILLAIFVCSLLMFSADSRNIRVLQSESADVSAAAFPASSTVHTSTSVSERHQGLELETKLKIQSFPHRSTANSSSQDSRYNQPTPSGPSRGHNSVPTP